VPGILYLKVIIEKTAKTRFFYLQKLYIYVIITLIIFLLYE